MPRQLVAAVSFGFAITAGLLAHPQPGHGPDQPKTAREWRQAGAARQKAKDYDGAIEAYRKSLEIEPDSPAVFFNLGTTHALNHQVDAALNGSSGRKRPIAWTCRSSRRMTI
jgi:tetratricopeptide (TPR) repeat protein